MNKTQSENSITLTWTPVNKFNYTLIVNGKEKENFTQPSSDLKEYVVGDLTSGTEHEFRLFTVFKYARSSGEDITAVTGKASLVWFKDGKIKSLFEENYFKEEKNSEKSSSFQFLQN